MQKGKFIMGLATGKAMTHLKPEKPFMAIFPSRH
jgi:hypothetical protein